jgi:peroxiredoxin
MGIAQPPAAPHRRALRLAVRLAALALIAAAIWYLQSGGNLPFAGTTGDRDTAPDVGSDSFVSFRSQGIKLGAAAGSAPAIGDAAPDFALLDPTGTIVRLSDFRGRTVVLNFWATWCRPCRKEFPDLVRLYERNAGRGLVVLGVNLQENPGIVAGFAAEFGAKFPIVIDTAGDVARRYRVLGLPETAFIDSQGVLRAKHIGLLTEEVLAKKLGEAGFAVTDGP